MKKVITFFVIFTATVTCVFSQTITKRSFNYQDSKAAGATNMTADQMAGWLEGTYTPPALYANATASEIADARLISAIWDSSHYNAINIKEKGWLYHDSTGKPKTILIKQLPALIRQGAKKGWLVFKPVTGEHEWYAIEEKDGKADGKFPTIKRGPHPYELRAVTVAKSSTNYDGPSAFCGNHSPDMVFLTDIGNDKSEEESGKGGTSSTSSGDDELTPEEKDLAKRAAEKGGIVIINHNNSSATATGGDAKATNTNTNTSSGVRGGSDDSGSDLSETFIERQNRLIRESTTTTTTRSTGCTNCNPDNIIRVGYSVPVNRHGRPKSDPATISLATTDAVKTGTFLFGLVWALTHRGQSGGKLGGPQMGGGIQ